VSHDVIIGGYATLAPGVKVSGRVRIGARAYIGTNASIINGESDAPLLIGDDAVVGAAACVTRDVAPATTVVGVPARPR
jgi:acetyltransferase-like isoleucine patch superfamily enzyme